MIERLAVEDAYAALDDLVIELGRAGFSSLAAALHHRVHQVDWTSGSELFNEIRGVFGELAPSDASNLPGELKERMARVLVSISKLLQDAKG